MLSAGNVYEHLATVDADEWPGVARVPEGVLVAAKARLAEARFAAACAQAGVELDPDRGALVRVEHDAVFRRVADSGWVGLAEGFLAGEWSVESSAALVDALAALLKVNYAPRTPAVASGRAGSGGEIPPDLIRHFSGDGMSPFAGHFATGVPTTQRERVRSYAPCGLGRRAAAFHYVDRTEFSAPLDAQRDDLADVQARSVEMLLDACGAARGTHVLEYPSSGGAVAIAAARRHATVDVWLAGEAAERQLRDRLVYAGVADAVHVELVGSNPEPVPPRRGHYDGVVSVEKLETLDPSRKGGYLSALGGLVGPGGRVALQTLVRTEAFTPAARASLQSLRAYVWPGLSFSTPTELARIVDRRTRLRIVAETRAPEHLEASLRLQRELFDGRLREAAADGYDRVYRRLWQWQFALREALARLGMIDLAQMTLVPRDRQGRR